VPGRRDPTLTPYVIEPERVIASGASKRVILMFGAQTGKTDAVLDCAGQRLDQRPAPILYVGPNKQFLTEQFEPRVMALLDEAPTLTAKVARGKRMTKTRKTVAGVSFRLAHAGSSAALKSDPAALVFVDEYDEMKGDVNEQGGPLGLAERRGDTYADFVCVVTSTPSRGRVEAVEDRRSGLVFWDVAMSDDIESPIWQLWQQGSRYHWCWPCPHCEEFFVPRFNLMRWPANATPMVAARATYLECPRCGGVIEDQHKADMNERGRYVAPGQTIDKAGNVAGDPPDTMATSYWVSGLASPFVTFGERIRVYLEAVAMGDPAEIQQSINAGFGELWSPGGGDAPEWAEIKEKSRLSLYERGEVPDDVLRLSIAIDVQKQSVPWVIRGFGPRATSWLIDWGYLRGDTAEPEIWDELAQFISTPVDGVPINVAFIDSGFRPGKKDTLPLNRIYEFCRRFPKRVRPTKGSSGPLRVPLMISKIEINRTGKAAKFGLDLIRLDTDHWKCWVHERLRWPADQVGAWYVPRGVDDDYCRQIVSEARLKKPNGMPEWVPLSKHNHFLDCEAMAAASSYLMNMQRVAPPPPKETGDEDEAPAKERVPAPSQPAPVVMTRYPRAARRVVRSGYL